MTSSTAEAPVFCAKKCLVPRFWTHCQETGARSDGERDEDDWVVGEPAREWWLFLPSFYLEVWDLGGLSDGIPGFLKRTACPTIGMLRSGQTPLRNSAWMGCKECTYIQIFFVRRPKPSQKGKFKLGGPWHVVPKGQNAVVRFPARFPWRGGVIYRVSLPIDGRSLGCKMGSAWFNSSQEIEFWVIWIQKLFRI